MKKNRYSTPVRYPVPVSGRKSWPLLVRGGVLFAIRGENTSTSTRVQLDPVCTENNPTLDVSSTRVFVYYTLDVSRCTLPGYMNVHVHTGY